MGSVKLNGSTSGYVELTPPAVAGTTTLTLPTVSGTLAVEGGTTLLEIISSAREPWNIVASTVTGTINCDYETAQNWYYTTASTAGASTINLRGSATTSMNTFLSTGESATATFLVKTGASTPAYFGTVQVDGTVTGVTTLWRDGVAPTSGAVSSTTAYYFTVIKTASAAYTVIASSVVYA